MGILLGSGPSSGTGTDPMFYVLCGSESLLISSIISFGADVAQW